MAKKLFIEELELRRSTSPLFVISRVNDQGKMPEYSGKEFKKPNDSIVTSEEAGNVPGDKPIPPGPIHTTLAMGEEGNPARWRRWLIWEWRMEQR